MKAVTTITISKELDDVQEAAVKVMMKSMPEVIQEATETMKSFAEDIFVRDGETIEVEISYRENIVEE